MIIFSISCYEANRVLFMTLLFYYVKISEKIKQKYAVRRWTHAFFHYKGNELYAEDVPVRALAEKYGTPLYVYSYKTLLRHFKCL